MPHFFLKVTLEVGSDSIVVEQSIINVKEENYIVAHNETLTGSKI